MLPPVTEDAVFLNIPYDKNFERPYLAYIVGLVELGLEPRVTLGVPGGDRRLDRILELIQSCRYSIHDLSRVEVARRTPRIPRFNMPFELGLTVTWAKLNPTLQTWFVCETERYRVDRSLSDLGGTDRIFMTGPSQVSCGNCATRLFAVRVLAPPSLKWYIATERWPVENKKSCPMPEPIPCSRRGSSRISFSLQRRSSKRDSLPNSPAEYPVLASPADIHIAVYAICVAFNFKGRRVGA